MVRQFSFFFLLSILTVLFAQYAHLLIVYIDMLYASLNLRLVPVFSQTGIGIGLRKVILLVFLPIAIAGVPALIYRLIKGSTMPYLIELTWFLWIVIALSNILI